MPDSQAVIEARQLLDTARMLKADAQRNGVAFVNTELDLSKTFAERAWALFAQGLSARAHLNALAATEAYQTAKRFFPSVGRGQQRQQLAVKIGNLTPLMEQLAVLI